MRKANGLALLLAGGLLLAGSPAAALEVTSNNVTASPASSANHPCPVKFTFRGKVALSKEGRFTYRWERSDGAVDTIAHPPAVFDGVHGAIIETTWTLGANGVAAFHPFRGWMKLHVLTPQDRLSNAAEITLDCGAPPPTVNPAAFQRPGPGGAQLPPPK